MGRKVVGGDRQKRGALCPIKAPEATCEEVRRYFLSFSLRVVVPLERSKFLIKGSESCSVDSYFKGVGVTGMLKKCEKNVKSYFLRETVKQEPVG